MGRISLDNTCGEGWKTGVDLLFFDLRCIMKVVAATQRIKTAEQPTTIPSTAPRLKWDREVEIGELEGFEVTGFVVLEVLSGVGSKSSFTAADVHNGC